MLELNKIHCGDCFVLLEELPFESVDICITSPPYKDEDNFEPWYIRRIFDKIFCRLKEDSLFFLNFGHLAEDKFRPFWTCRTALEAGFKLQDTIVWVKNHFSPIQGKKRLNNLTEFIFMLVKGNPPNLDRLSIGVPYKDKSNIGRYSDRDLRCGGNVWFMDYETVQDKAQKLHNDRFPLELPIRCIKLAGLPKGSLVLEPFAGSGTTCLAAKKLGMNYLGFEINPSHVETATRRLAEEERKELIFS